MSPFNPLFPFICLVAALSMAWLLAIFFGDPPSHGRFASIDGLRGFLACFVFMRHAENYYLNLADPTGGIPSKNLFIQFAESGVAAFFMITAFLFFSRLTNQRKQKIDWLRLYCSRLMRLAPLYYFMVFLLFGIVMILSGFKIHTHIPPSKVVSDGARWLACGFMEYPKINNINAVGICSRVVWTLPYEWGFYLLLPALSVLTGVIPRFRVFSISLIFCCGMFCLTNLDEIYQWNIWHPSFSIMQSFFAGMVAAVLVRFDLVRKFARTKVASIVVIGCSLALLHFNTQYSFWPRLLLATAFILVACGNTLFGILTMPAARMLGQISYSIYLLHGMILFVFFILVLKVRAPHVFPPITFWGMILFLVTITVPISFLTFSCIEHPMMQRTPALVEWLRTRTQRQKSFLNSMASGMMFWKS